MDEKSTACCTTSCQEVACSACKTSILHEKNRAAAAKQSKAAAKQSRCQRSLQAKKAAAFHAAQPFLHMSMLATCSRGDFRMLQQSPLPRPLPVPADSATRQPSRRSPSEAMLGAPAAPSESRSSSARSRSAPASNQTPPVITTERPCPSARSEKASPTADRKAKTPQAMKTRPPIDRMVR